MSGLIYKDLLAFVRRTYKTTWVFEAVFFLFFIFGIKQPISVFTYCLLVVPISASGMATTLKELDISCSSARINLTLPFTHRELVLSRFLTAFSMHIVYASEMAIFCTIRYFVYGQFSVGTYLSICAAGILTGLIITSLNLLSTFASSLNTSAILYLVIIAVVFSIYLIFLFAGIDVTKLLQMNTGILLILGVAVTLLVIFFSYVVSLKMYVKKLG